MEQPTKYEVSYEGNIQPQRMGFPIQTESNQQFKEQNGMLEKLWELYKDAVWEDVKMRKKQESTDEENKGFSMIESITANGKANGILRCIETLSENPKSTWMKSFEIWTRANGNVQAYDFWTPCSKRLPEKIGWYLVSRKDGFVNVGYFFEDNTWRTAKGQEVIAWMPLPPIYEEE